MAGKPRLFPRFTIEDALKVPRVIKDNNGGKPWATDQVAEAIGFGAKSTNLYYITAASRDYGFTEGTRETTSISMTPLGVQAVSPRSVEEEVEARRTAFLRIEMFRKVLDHFGGNELPERKFLQNTLEQEFGIPEPQYDDFVEVFTKNARFVKVGVGQGGSPLPVDPAVTDGGSITVATPDTTENGTAPVCFVIMPFSERNEERDPGFFTEVLNQLFIPAAKKAGFEVKTAHRQGSDLIQSTIVNALIDADLVLADLTDHNPNVLFELGIRMKEDKPVVLVRARGTGRIFDVDSNLRVLDYNPNLWTSSIADDLPKLTAHVEGAWANRASADTYMKILLRQRPPAATAAAATAHEEEA